MIAQGSSKLTSEELRDSAQRSGAGDIANPEPLPENILSVSTRGRAWNGVRIAVTEFHCSGRVSHRLHDGRDTLLSVVLEEVGGVVEPRFREDQRCPVAYTPRHMHFAPAGLETWGYTNGVRFVKDVGLYFDVPTLEERLGTTLDTDLVSTPRLRFSDDRIWTLARLLADAVDDPDPSAQLYGDGLTAAIASQLFAKAPVSEAASVRGLAPWQLRRVVEYMNAHLPKRIDLAQLAALVGLSQSHFSRAFKASTGTAPYRWQLDARIRRAQTLLMDTRATLEHVAELTGFADAVHFGRTFRKITGTSPAAWRNAADRTTRHSVAESNW